MLYAECTWKTESLSWRPGGGQAEIRRDVRRAAELVPRESRWPRAAGERGGTAIQPIATEERNREYRRIAGERRGDRNPKVEAAIPAADFAGIVPASRGAHCRPLHPRLASLCSAPEAAFVGPVSGETTEPKGATATASQETQVR